MPDEKQTEVADLLSKAFGIGGRLQGVKLGPGVVGRNTSILWIFEVVMLAGIAVGAFQRNMTIVGISLAGAIVGVLYGLSLNTYFAMRNPAAALLEGSEFLQHELTKMGSKDKPIIDVTSTPTPPPSLPEDPKRDSLPGASS
jgi:hypothetical protein